MIALRTFMRIFICILTLLPCLAFGADSVYFVPSKPTSADSITFHLHSENLCCCAVYNGNSVSVMDTQINLNFFFDNNPCETCRCFSTGSWTQFKSGPLQAGTYAIYERGSINCPPGTPCPANILGVLVGRINISPAANVMLDHSKLSFSHFSIKQNGGSSFQMDFSLPSVSRVKISIFNLQGKIVATPFDNNASRGNHSIYWNASGCNGTYLVRLTQNGIPMACSKVILIK